MKAKSKRENRIFLDSVLEGNTVTIKEMLLKGSPVEARDTEHGETALMFAVKFDRDAIIPLLLGAGADVNAKDVAGRTPLMVARAKYVPALLAAGAQINTQDEEGQTALMKAVAAADIDKATALLEAGADSRISDYEGKEAWDRANDLGVKVLIDLIQPLKT